MTTLPAILARFGRREALVRPRWVAGVLVALLIGWVTPIGAAPAAVVGRYALPDWFPLRGEHALGCTNGNGCLGGYHGYWALDMQGNKGDVVFAAGAGKVSARQSGQGANCDASQYSSGSQCPGGAKGNWILVDHLGGVQTFYMHLTDVYVSVGDWVDENSPIGTVGDSGRSTPGFFHLHYEERTASGSVAPRALAACNNGVRTSYPSVLGATSWAALAAFGVTMRSEGVGCAAQPYRSLSPQRLLDTRRGLGSPRSGPVVADAVLALSIDDDVVPASAASVVLNVTAVSPTEVGWLTVWPCGDAKPTASNLNFSPGHTVANLVVVRPGSAGRVCLAASRSVQILADLAGYQPTGSTFAASNPERLLDTRIGLGASARRLAADQVLRLQVSGRGAANVSPDALASVLNVTAVDPVSGGWLTVWPCEETKPETSNINYKAGQTIANLTVSKLGDRGVLCLSSTSATHLLADIAGWYPLGSTEVPVSASRVLDTRTGVGVAVGVWPIEQPLSFSVAGAGTPGDARSGVLNITAVNPDRGGYATVWPCGEPRPVASNLNFEAGDTIANMVITKLGPGATVCVAATANVHLVADLFGWSR